MDRPAQSQTKRKNATFFKVLIQDFSTFLQIPPAFNKVIGKDVPKKAMLETYYGKSEEVEVEKRENRVFFCKGWSKFVEDNKLENGDFLVFKYMSDYSKFKVKIYGKTCCEKECYNDVAGDQTNNNKRKRDEEEEDNVNEDDGETSKAAKRIETDSDVEDEASDEDEPIDIESDSSRPVVVEGDNDEREVAGKSKQSTSEERRNEEGEALANDNQIEFKSENPFFQVKLKSSSISSYLNIPLSFSREYIRKESQRQEIKLEMSKCNKMWDVGLMVLWGPGNKKVIAGARLSQGWKGFVSEYQLQMGDLCIFEMIHHTHHLLFRLHVHRWDQQNHKFIHIF
ncbi:putative B3 domain-containing protein Os03g0621600 [Prosopis cineraria]|uniref:putative B3 domain-containing protein Os03g0621600 n=1 Tax=Prosopis cineraria TaxID=364024 RepID=UPI0024108C29|nr:putative B3 domain-containing protein Os03g0621600 [Prosopis cineraria]